MKYGDRSHARQTVVVYFGGENGGTLRFCSRRIYKKHLNLFMVIFTIMKAPGSNSLNNSGGGSISHYDSLEDSNQKPFKMVDKQ